MSTRRQVVPALTDPGLTLDDLRVHVEAWRSDSHASASALRLLRQNVDENARWLESPQAIYEHIDHFIDRFSHAAIEIGRVCEALIDRASPADGQRLRQMADHAASERPRVVVFRDKWINKPLPFEQVRPLLSEIAVTVRDQLDDYRELTLAAAKLDERLGPAGTKTTSAAASTSRGFDRRALFNRVWRPEQDRDE